MPQRADATLDYELFDFKDFDEQPLGLGDAIRKAQKLRATDPYNFYRVVPADAELTAFRVEKVSRAEVYVDFLSRIAERWANLWARLHHSR